MVLRIAQIGKSRVSDLTESQPLLSPSANTMKYIALLSGGKDSCFNLLHCAKNGHELIAAASLGPEPGKEELDSYLYQTVGQDAIEFVAQALDVPLYRRTISGSAIELGSEYGGRRAHDAGGIVGDETEDLYELLSRVKNNHPDAQGVAVGAILSNYQRVRVEHVCLRLSLTPMCYLWQRSQEELLAEMINFGMEAILIKVAGIGLTTKHLGKSLTEMQPTLIRLNRLYGAHICGEGGEYETLTLDCPMFKKRIVLNDVETVIHSDSDFATVAYLRVKNASLVMKDPMPLSLPSTPPLLSEEFEDIDSSSQYLAQHNTADITNIDEQEISLPPSSRKLGKWVTISNVQRKEISSKIVSISDEVTECFELMKDLLAQYNLDFSHITFINIFISDMDRFPEMNQIYKTFFGTSPPARACVAIDLPSGVNVRLDCIAYAEESSQERQALHVQSLSYWAPANIGPYSQAVVINEERIFISGQIGMIPSSLNMPSPSNFRLEAALSFQHADRITVLLRDTWGSSWRPKKQCLICWLDNASNIIQLRDTIKMNDSTTSLPTLFVVSKALPKRAQVEAQLITHTGQYFTTDEHGKEAYICGPELTESGDFQLEESTIAWRISRFSETPAFCAVIAIKRVQADILRLLTTKVLSIWTGTYSIRLFYRQGFLKDAYSTITHIYSDKDVPAVTLIPVRFIATPEIDDWDFALCLVGTS